MGGSAAAGEPRQLANPVSRGVFAVDAALWTLVPSLLSAFNELAELSHGSGIPVNTDDGLHVEVQPF